jgi:MazG family protein
MGQRDSFRGLEGLAAIMDRLRGPDGCPWDRDQNYDTLRRYLLEECYEVAEAIDRDDGDGLCEELGDLLFQIVFLARLAKEHGRFTLDDVVQGIADKMVRRHPHVFGDGRADTSEEVVESWEAIKKREKEAAGETASAPPSALDGIPAGMPAVLAARQVGDRAARVGFDWSSPAEVLDKVEEELGELRRAVESGDRGAVTAEIGDAMFSLVMLARRWKVDPEGALAGTNLKFRRRFRWMEGALRREGVPLRDAGIERMEALWQKAKGEVG